jgi:hypothetical protein
MFQENKEEGAWWIKGTYAVEITKLVEELDSKKDTLIQLVRRHQHSIN